MCFLLALPPKASSKNPTSILENWLDLLLPLITFIHFVTYYRYHILVVKSLCRWCMPPALVPDACLSIYTLHYMSSCSRNEYWYGTYHTRSDRHLVALEFGQKAANVGPSQSVQLESIKDLLVVIEHFNKYPLITKKRVDFELFKLAVLLIKNKEHLTKEGLNN